MSTGLKRSLSSATEDAEAFRALFPSTCYRRWTFAGSVRRGRPDVGDIEHVIEPIHGDIDVGGGLFAERKAANLLWVRLEELVAAGHVARHVYGTTDTGAPRHRWGDKYRGVDFRGFNHELFCADADNWGPTLAIRTGPAEFSQHLVTSIRRHGMRNIGGYVWSCRPCPHCDRGNVPCAVCDGTGLDPVQRMSVGEEREYLTLCGVAWREPEARG